VYAVASRNKVPALLLIFPFTFQFLREDLQEPQRILRAHAEEHGVPSIDFTPVFEALIFGEARDKLRSDPELDKSRLREMVADQIGVYFLDADHLTPEGHRVVAEHLLAYLERQGLLDPQRQACPSAG
jgi:lysophospholipase L1-like esterase